MIFLPKPLAAVLDTLEANGFESYIVGGCVRDSLMGKEPHDFDVTTAATPREIKALFKKTYDTGIKHGTVTVAAGDRHYEVTTFRIDGSYADGRHPSDVSFTKSIERDLARRDFTMNAIAYSPRRGLTDLFGGAEDIKERIIRGVGEPSARFGEDALRMLRALRFASQLSFSIEAETFAAIVKNAGLISLISRERIQSELVKTLLGAEPVKVKLIYESGLLPYIFEGGADYAKKYGAIILAELARSHEDINERLAVLFRHLPEERAYALLTELKFDNKTKKTVCALIARAGDKITPEKVQIRKAAARLSPEFLRLLLKLKKTVEPGNVSVFEQAENELNGILQNGDCLSLKDLAVSGRDLKFMGIADGPAIGIMLNGLLELVLEDPAKNDFEVLKSTISLD